MPEPTVTESVSDAVTTDAVNLIGEPVSPVAVAVIVSLPAVAPAVSNVCARPVAPDADLSEAGTVRPRTEAQVTVSPATPLPNWSLIFTTSGEPKAALVCALWALPLDTAICVAAPEVAVAENDTGEPVAPPSVAVALWRRRLAQGPGRRRDAAGVGDRLGRSTEDRRRAAHLTVSPCTGVPLSVTITRNGLGRRCPPPPTARYRAGVAIPISGTGAADAVAEKVTGDPLAPASVAVACCVPAALPSVQVMVAMPFASVNDVVGATDAPVACAAQLTVVPTCGAPFSVTTTRSGLGSAVPTCAVCPSPLEVVVIAITGGGPVVLSLLLLQPWPSSGTAAATARRKTRRDFGAMAPILSVECLESLRL